MVLFGREMQRMQRVAGPIAAQWEQLESMTGVRES